MRRTRYPGSPPRVRGTGSLCSFRLMPKRITPACAGNSRTFPPDRPGKWDHPRVCGEQHSNSVTTGILWGSPPRVRGTVPSLPQATAIAGITPACAGNSNSNSSSVKILGDHPRVCGEQAPILSAEELEGGSPPRVRGTAFSVLISVNRRRITPACAGNSWPRGPPLPGMQDHPRVCGEQGKSRCSIGHGIGSPPRVRGTADPNLKETTSGRITPACAGNRP